MIAQRIKNWLRRIFSWWQASPVEYRQDSGALSAVRPSEGMSRSVLEGTTPQANTTNTTGTTGTTSTTSSLSTIEERPVYTPLTPSPANEDPTLLPPTDPPTPTPQQRLEFLRYLVQQGLVNEGKEE